MPIATPEQYNAMLDAAKAGKYAYPAINITSSETLNAALRGFAEAESDGIIQVSHGGGSFASGTYVNSMALGAQAIAEMAHLMADHYNVLIAMHTDHCQADKVDTFIRPLLEVTLDPGPQLGVGFERGLDAAVVQRGMSRYVDDVHQCQWRLGGGEGLGDLEGPPGVL